MQDPALVAPGPRAGTREWVGLSVLALPAFVIALDFSVLNLAVPEISRELMPTATELLWIVSSRRASSGISKTSARSSTLHDADGIRPAATAGIPDIYCKSCPVTRKRASALLARRAEPARNHPKLPRLPNCA